MDLYEVGKHTQSLKNRLERLESASKPCLHKADAQAYNQIIFADSMFRSN